MPDTGPVTSAGGSRWAPRLSVIGAGIGLSVGTVALLAGGIWFAQVERQRDLSGWERRLRIIADSRVAAIDGWLGRQSAEMAALSTNTGLQLYMTQLDEAGGRREQVAEEPAQAAYLRNLFIVTADRAGFQAQAFGPQVEANVGRVGTAGIALLDRRFNVQIATPLIPPVDDDLKAFLAAQPVNRPSVRPAYLGVGGTATMAFAAPVFAVQADAATSQPIGFVLGIRELDKEFFSTLQQPGAAEVSAEGSLLQRDRNTLTVVSPPLDGSKPLQRSIRLDTPGSVEVDAVTRPGAFVTGRDHRNRDILGVSRAPSFAPWVLLYKVDRGEALADSDARRRNMLFALFLLAFGIDIAFVAVWRHASSRRANETAQQMSKLANRLEAHETLLRLVADYQLDVIFLMDDSGHLQFANRAAAQRVELSGDDLIGKPVAAVYGPEEARRLERLNRQMTTSHPPSRVVERLLRDGGDRVIESTHVPVPPTKGSRSGVLVVERDVTDVAVAQERRAQSLRELIAALVALVDRRDPFASEHSARVAEVARLIAQEMHLEPNQAATAETAGHLMNLGKMLLPAELLTKAGELTDLEREQVRAAMLSGADIVAGIDFDGPVEETLRQIYERWDGSGYPGHLSGEAIVLPARIVAVANAFVAMTSSRAWREAASIERATDQILSETGRAFDRGVAIALANVIENRGGKLRLRPTGVAPPGV